MTWAYFQNQAAFDAYHDAVCADQGIPRPGYRQSDQALQLFAQWTDAYVDPIRVRATGNVTAWVAQVPPAHVTQYNLGLNIPDEQVTFVDGVATFTYQGRTYTGQPTVGFNWRKPKPPTWTDPNSGKTYNTSTGEEIP